MKKNIFLRLLVFLALFNMVLFFSGCGTTNTTPSSSDTSGPLTSTRKIIGVGNVSSYNDTLPIGGIFRIDNYAVYDSLFQSGTGATDLRFIYSIARQSDGKLIIGGSFTSYDGTTRTRIARLSSNGALDFSFNPGAGADSQIECIAVQPDGKILIGGHFTTYDGVARNYIARINADGSLDTTFDAGTLAVRYVFSIAVQNDGKILIGGFFNNAFGGTGYDRVERLNADGTIDNTFNPGTSANNTINVIALQSDGKLLIGGTFSSFNGTARKNIARVNADGSLDATFDPGTGADNWLYSMAIQSDGKILIGGAFTTYNGTARKGIARINADGSLDATFDPGTGFSGGNIGGSYAIRSIAVQNDGKIVIGGNFTSFNGSSRTGILRITSTGALDESFDTGTGAADVYSLLITE